MWRPFEFKRNRCKQALFRAAIDVWERRHRASRGRRATAPSTRFRVDLGMLQQADAETSGANAKPALQTAPIREHTELADTALQTAEGCQCCGFPLGCGARWGREGIKHEVHEDGEPGL